MRRALQEMQRRPLQENGTTRSMRQAEHCRRMKPVGCKISAEVLLRARTCSEPLDGPDPAPTLALRCPERAVGSAPIIPDAVGFEDAGASRCLSPVIAPM